MSIHFIANVTEDKDSLHFGYYLSGLTDGEGCFFLHADKRRISASWAMFSIGLRSDDESILKEVKSYLRCGRIKRDRQNSKKGKPRSTFIVTNLNNLIRTIIPFFKTHPLRAKKARDFEVWQKGVLFLYKMKIRRSHHTRFGKRPKWTEQDIEEYKNIYITLKETRKYDNRTKIEIPKRKERKSLFD